MVVEGWSFGLIYCHRAWAPSYLVEYEFYLDKRIHECEACLTAEDWANGTMIPRKPAYLNQISWKIIMVSQWPSQSPYLNLTEVLLQDLEKLCINECPPDYNVLKNTYIPQQQCERWSQTANNYFKLLLVLEVTELWNVIVCHSTLFSHVRNSRSTNTCIYPSIWVASQLPLSRRMQSTASAQDYHLY